MDFYDRWYKRLDEVLLQLIRGMQTMAQQLETLETLLRDLRAYRESTFLDHRRHSAMHSVAGHLSVTKAIKDFKQDIVMKFNDLRDDVVAHRHNVEKRLQALEQHAQRTKQPPNSSTTSTSSSRRSPNAQNVVSIHRMRAPKVRATVPKVFSHQQPHDHRATLARARNNADGHDSLDNSARFDMTLASHQIDETAAAPPPPPLPPPSPRAPAPAPAPEAAAAAATGSGPAATPPPSPPPSPAAAAAAGSPEKSRRRQSEADGFASAAIKRRALRARKRSYKDNEPADEDTSTDDSNSAEQSRVRVSKKKSRNDDSTETAMMNKINASSSSSGPPPAVVPSEVLQRVDSQNSATPSERVNTLLNALFTMKELRSSSVTGRAIVEGSDGVVQISTQGKLDERKLAAITKDVMERFDMEEDEAKGLVRKCARNKCANAKRRCK